MLNWLIRLFRKAPPPAPKSASEKFFDALDAFNKAWDEYEKSEEAKGSRYSDRLSPWMDWQERCLTMTVRDRTTVHRTHRAA